MMQGQLNNQNTVLEGFEGPVRGLNPKLYNDGFRVYQGF